MTTITTGPDGQPPATPAERNRAMSDEQKPAPCPWCGSEGIVVAGTVDLWVACNAASCGATGPSGRTSDLAIAAWNRIAQRHAPAADTDLDALTELIEAAEECASDLACHVNTITTENDRRLYDSERRRHETDMAPVSRLRAAVARVRVRGE